MNLHDHFPRHRNLTTFSIYSQHKTETKKQTSGTLKKNQVSDHMKQKEVT